MLGVGPQEIAVIALFALIIFGPGKLPEVMREAGKHYAKFKGMADQMTGELGKVTADARKELDGAFGDLGPLGKDLEKTLGGGKTSRTTSSGSKSTSSSTAKKSTSTSSTKKSTTSGSSGSRTTAAGSKTSSSTKSTSTASTVGQVKAKPVVASKEDPLADFAMFEGDKKETKRRTRSAAPSAITDFTPRDFFGEEDSASAENAPVAASSSVTDMLASDDPVARARARRRTAGYARA